MEEFDLLCIQYLTTSHMENVCQMAHCVIRGTMNNVVGVGLSVKIIGE